MLNTNKGDTRQGLRRGDIVVFYIGVNEAKNAIVYRDPITRLSLQFSTFESASNWVFKHTNVGYSLNNLLAVGKASIDENNLAETKLALDTAESFTSDRGATFIPIIQPHVFTKSGPLKYEQAISLEFFRIRTPCPSRSSIWPSSLPVLTIAAKSLKMYINSCR